MAARYYLMNGKNGKGNAVNLLVNGKVVHDFDDIASLDLETLKMTIQEAKEELAQYNSDIILDGGFYDLSYPHNKTIIQKHYDIVTHGDYVSKDKVVVSKSYASIFNYSNPEVRYYLDKLRYFAEQRKYNKENGKHLQLSSTQELDDYVFKILFDLFDNPNKNLTSYGSLMSKALKSLINDRYYLCSDKSNNQFVQSRIHIIRSLLTNYTELRNLTIEYILYILGKNTNIRSYINGCEQWDNKGLDKNECIDLSLVKYNNYQQLHLSDFMNMSRTFKKN